MCTILNRLFALNALLIVFCLSTRLYGQMGQQTKVEYCQPSYTNGCSNNNGLASVLINGIALSQNSGCSVGGYGQFTAVSTTLTTGQANTFSITLLDPNRPHGITIWADLNRNFTLDIGEDLFLSNGPLTGPISGTFTIPVITPGGPLRLRVLSAYNTMPFWPCSIQNGVLIPYDTGEAEDYTVNVLSPITDLTTTNITDKSAQLSWTNSATGVSSFDIQYREQGSPYWNNRTSFGTQNTLNVHVNGYTAYEWQVRQTGTTDYTGPVSFTTPCGPPDYLGYPAATRTMAQISWSPNFGSPYTLRYRVAGITDWATVANITLPVSYTGATPYYSLTGLTPSTPYEYQVQRNCSPTANSQFTGTQSFTTLSCSAPSPYIQNLRSNSVSLYWGDYTEPGQTFKVQYRPVGSASWTTIDSITANSYSPSGTTTNIAYEWQVQRVCSPAESSSYSPGPTFTLACPTPTLLSGIPTATGVFLVWQIDPTEANKRFDIQYRQQGTTDWTMISSLTTTGTSMHGYSLTGLSRNTAYEWRIRSICPTGVPSDYTDVRSFTTVCTSPTSQENVLISASSALVRWYGPSVDAATYHELRYRAIGVPDWTTVNTLTSTQGQSNYLFTGLTNNTIYEWQIRAVCSPTESGSFTPPASFTTTCRAPTAYNRFLGVASRVSSATLAWNHTGVNVMYEVYYRPVGSANWLVVSNIPSSSVISVFNNNTVLVTNLQSGTPYEWQVRTQCGNGIVSGFSNVESFTTSPCIIPFGNSQAVSDYTANLRWTYYGADAETRFEIRWRAVGSPMWISAGNLTVNELSNGILSLTGLTPNTAYEWQIRARCSLNQLTDFSALINFQTIPVCLSMQTIRHGYWSDPTTWSCNRAPLPTDVVQIRHNVFFNSNEVGNALRVQFEPGGKLYYSLNAKLQLGL